VHLDRVTDAQRVPLEPQHDGPAIRRPGAPAGGRVMRRRDRDIVAPCLPRRVAASRSGEASGLRARRPCGRPTESRRPYRVVRSPYRRGRDPRDQRPGADPPRAR
jgi:hypothetical protein